MKTHFRVPARELLLDEPEPCLVLPALTFDGIAIDEHDRQYLILNYPNARCYAGPDTATVQRTAEIFAAALRDGPAHVDPNIVEVSYWWICECWEALTDELVEQLTPDLADL